MRSFTGAIGPRPERGNEFDDGIIFEVNDMTPYDYAKRIENYHNEVIRAWQEDQRVKALKIVIQVGSVSYDDGELLRSLRV